MKNIAKKVIISRLNSKLRKLLSAYDITVIAVTGSIGKTTTKQAIGQVLESTRKVRYSQDSYNTDIGIPLSIFGQKVPNKLWDPRAWQKIFKDIDDEVADYQYDTVVLEMADDELMMMRKVLNMIQPDISVVSAIAPVHMERLKDIKTVLHDNWVIASGAKKIIYNADSELLRKKVYKKDTIGFGLKHGTIRFSKVSRSSNSLLKAELQIGKHKKIIHTKMIGEQNLYALLAAASVANELDIPFGAICFELSQVTPVIGRMNLLPAINGAKLIDDSYNSSPDAAKAALQTLHSLSGKKIAVLGSMNELGEHTDAGHQEVGEEAAKVVDLLVTVGKSAGDITAPAARRAGLDADNIKVFRTPYEAGHYVKNIIKKGDIVLVKGSQAGVFTEEASRILLDPKKSQVDNLVRQSKVWKKRKKKSFAQ